MEYISGYSDKTQIIKMWQECFGDEQNYINLFFNNCFKDITCYGCTQNNSLVAMLFMMPTTLVFGDKTASGRYVYAVTTSPNFRGKGISKKLLNFAEQTEKNKGAEFTALVPASGSLFDFYKNQGYESYFYLNIYTVNSEDNFSDLITLKSGKPNDIKLIRDSYFTDSDCFISWNNSFLEHIKAEANYTCGDILTFDNGYMACYKVDDTLYIKEIVCNDKDKKSAIFSAIKKYNATKAIVREKADKLDNNSIPFGMIKWFSRLSINSKSKYKPYISLVLD